MSPKGAAATVSIRFIKWAPPGCYRPSPPGQIRRLRFCPVFLPRFREERRRDLHLSLWHLVRQRDYALCRRRGRWRASRRSGFHQGRFTEVEPGKRHMAARLCFAERPGPRHTLFVSNYPASLNPATAGLRNITGKVNADGTVTVWGVTSTVSTNGDQGADPNKLVMITDLLANTTASGATNEQFTVVKSAAAGEVLRGVALTPNETSTMVNSPLILSAASPKCSRDRTGFQSGCQRTGSRRRISWTDLWGAAHGFLRHVRLDRRLSRQYLDRSTVICFSE